MLLLLVQFSPIVDTATLCTVPIHKGITSGSKIQVDLSSKSAQTLNTVRNVLYYAGLLENTNCIIKSQKELALGLMYIGSDGTTSARCIITFWDTNHCRNTCCYIN